MRTVLWYGWMAVKAVWLVVGFVVIVTLYLMTGGMIGAFLSTDRR